jgi:hypothetical protein
MNAGGTNRKGCQILAGPSCTERLPPDFFSAARDQLIRIGLKVALWSSPGTSAMVAFVMSEVPKRQLASLEGTVSRPDSRTQSRSRVDKIKEQMRARNEVSTEMSEGRNEAVS